MPKTRKLIHAHCKSTNEDWYYFSYNSMKKDELKFPVSIKTIRNLLNTVDYFERKSFYFRKSKVALKPYKEAQINK